MRIREAIFRIFCSQVSGDLSPNAEDFSLETQCRKKNHGGPIMWNAFSLISFVELGGREKAKIILKIIYLFGHKKNNKHPRSER